MAALSPLTANLGPLSSAPGIVFTPDQLPNLYFWYKADALVLNDLDPVASWTDSSGNGRHAVQAVAGKKPTYRTSILNGQPIVRFDGGDALATASISLGAYTRFIVFNSTQNGIVYELGPDANTSPGGYFYTGNFHTIFTSRGATPDKTSYITAQGWNDSVFRTTAHRYNGTNATHTLWLNGSAVSWTSNPNASDPGTSAATDTFYLGARTEASLFFAGDMAEVINYNTSLSDGDREQVEGYLKNKYAHYA